MNDFEKELNMNYLKNESLKKHTTLKVGGECSYFVIPKNIIELKRLIKLIKKYNLKYMIIGNGSNLVFSSIKYKGVIISLKEFNRFKIIKNELTCQSGCLISKVALECINKELSGLEFANGIPATIGGAIYQNAGAYNQDISMCLKSVTCLNDKLEIIVLSNKKCKFTYRSSIFKENNNLIILEAKFELKRDNKELLLEMVENRRKNRFNSQPLDMPSAGSVFKNPEGLSAWQLIDGIKMRGKKIGGAMVSEKHTNFIVNDNNATGEDICALIKEIQTKVKNKYNIELEPEQEFVNFCK